MFIWIGTGSKLLPALGFCPRRGEIPKELGQLHSLAFLNLYGANLTGEIPAELGQLPNLKVLDLSFNNLWGKIPGELGHIQGIEYLALSRNALEGHYDRKANFWSLF